MQGARSAESEIERLCTASLRAPRNDTDKLRSRFLSFSLVRLNNLAKTMPNKNMRFLYSRSHISGRNQVLFA